MSRFKFLTRFTLGTVPVDIDKLIDTADVGDVIDMSHPEHHHLLNRSHVSKLLDMPYKSHRTGLLSHPLVTEQEQLDNREYLDPEDIKTKRVHDEILSGYEKDSLHPIKRFDVRPKLYSLLSRSQLLSKEQVDRHKVTNPFAIEQNPYIPKEWKE